MAETWTIKRCLDWTRDYLTDKKRDDRARFSAELLLCSATGMSRMDLYLNYDRPLSTEELDLMHKYVVRRMKGEPLQYITGDTQFRTLEIACEPGVLIPRPETEMLVEEVLDFLDAEVLEGAGKSRPRVELPWNSELEAARAAELEAAAAKRAEEASDEEGGGEDPVDEGAEGGEPEPRPAPEPSPEPRLARVLEIGCGTGCVSLSLAAERLGHVACVATDVEPRAVALSLKNRDALGIDPTLADFREGDLTSPVRDDERGTFDVLVSNPPYIPEAVMAQVPDEVKCFEPELALVSGADGLDMFRRILETAPHYLRPGGLLACELYEGAVDTAASLCLSAGFADARVVPDLTRRPRFVLARLPR